MKRFRWLIVPLLAASISGCAFIEEAEREAQRARRAEEMRIRDEAERRVRERSAWAERRTELGHTLAIAVRRVESLRVDLVGARERNEVNPTPATWEAYQRAIAEFNDADEAERRARAAWEAGDAEYYEAIRREVGVIRGEREREAREREERQRGGNGGNGGGD